MEVGLVEEVIASFNVLGISPSLLQDLAYFQACDLLIKNLLTDFEPRNTEL